MTYKPPTRNASMACTFCSLARCSLCKTTIGMIRIAVSIPGFEYLKMLSINKAVSQLSFAFHWNFLQSGKSYKIAVAAIPTTNKTTQRASNRRVEMTNHFKELKIDRYSDNIDSFTVVMTSSWNALKTHMT